MKLLTTPLFLCFTLSLLGQSFVNPSFEDTIYREKPPQNWMKCTGTPDTNPLGYVNLTPTDGNSYTGFVYASWGYWEEISQNINGILRAGQQYHFSVDLASVYSDEAGFQGPGTLKIWLGNATCAHSQMIDSVFVSDSIWRKHQVNFIPNGNYTTISFGTDVGIQGQHNYVAMDNLSLIDSIFTIDTFYSVPSWIKPTSTILDNCQVDIRYPNIILTNPTNEILTLNIISCLGQTVHQAFVHPGVNTVLVDKYNISGVTFFLFNNGQFKVTKKVILPW